MKEKLLLIDQPKEDISKEDQIRRRLPDWAKDFDISNRGNIQGTYYNIETVLLNHPNYKDKFRFNEYTGKVEYNGSDISGSIRKTLRKQVSTILKVTVTSLVDDVVDSFESSSELHYHPAREYFNSLIWDGESRLETVLIDWFKADDNLLYREMTKKWFIGAVKRILNPGCKFDNILILAGPPGTGKTEFCKRLAKTFGCANLSESDLSNPTQYIPKLRNNWIISLDERGALSKKDQNFLKTFITETADSGRLSYEKDNGTYPRHCIFIGSTNDKRFLNDYSIKEERRYWIVNCPSEDQYYVVENFNDELVDQLWAEAYQLYIQDPDQKLILTREAYELFKKDQRQYKTLADDDAYLLLDEKLNNTLYPRDTFDSCEEFSSVLSGVTGYTNREYTLNKIPVNYINYYINKELKGIPKAKLVAILEEIGFEKKPASYKRQGKFTTVQCWVRKTENQELPLETESL